MEDMNAIVARNIRRLRDNRQLSLDELARLSGVSRSMLARIERGEGNPTLSTLWKVANGLGLPFDELTVRPKADFELVRAEDVQPILEDGGRVRNYSVFPDGENRRFAVYYMELEPGSRWTSEAHMRGTAEFITVFSGELELETAGRSLRVGARENLRFPADSEHTYANAGEGVCALEMILYNP